MSQGRAFRFAGFLEQTFTDGLLVLKDGAIAYERYFNGMDAQSLHLSQSVAKSFVGMLAGILARRRVIAVNALITDYLPELKATAYSGATLRQVLDMTSGVRFTEDYTDPLLRYGAGRCGVRVEAGPRWR